MPNQTASRRLPVPAAPHPTTADARPLPDARPLSAALPLSGALLDGIAGRLAAATVVGIGESTRFSHETFGVRDQLFRRLIREHGFRALAVQDSAGAAAALDAYVRGGEGTAASALAGAWGPWRTAEMAATLEWIRAFNRDHANDAVRVFGVKPVQARSADYDAVLDHVRGTAPDRLAEVASHLDPIRTAHETEEHVQRARGIHPGRPFAEHARDALALVASLPGADEVRGKMRLIVDFHEHSVAGRANYVGEAEAWAGVVAAFQRRTGLRTVYWDGIAHTSAAETLLGVVPERGPQATVGSLLRKGYGGQYSSVAIGVHHGDLGIAVLPEPAAGLVDARLGTDDLPARWLDLRDEDTRRRWDGPAKARVISGVYTPARDAAEYLAVASLADAFDVLIQVRQASPVRRLP
ncbi:erythromycin esterase family protein [Streptomyces sp. M-16]|uniref:erythromycin esterase family protein n=1 Tax=Streptomyces sp. M-16 TaxID=3233040 RepID=UPI003F951607